MYVHLTLVFQSSKRVLCRTHADTPVETLPRPNAKVEIEMEWRLVRDQLEWKIVSDGMQCVLQLNFWLRFAEFLVLSPIPDPYGTVRCESHHSLYSTRVLESLRSCFFPQ